MWFLERETPIRFKMQDEGGPLVAKQLEELGALEESESKRLHEVRYSTHVASSHTAPRPFSPWVVTAPSVALLLMR